MKQLKKSMNDAQLKGAVPGEWKFWSKQTACLNSFEKKYIIWSDLDLKFFLSLWFTKAL